MLYNSRMANDYRVRTITCVGCGVVSTKRRPPGQGYCSLSCYRKSDRPQRKLGATVLCAECGAPVYIPKHRLGEVNFCCQEHANNWQGRNKSVLTCKHCRKTFRRSASHQKNGNATYCSVKCRDADPDWRSMLISMNVKQQAGKQTKPEAAGYAILDSLELAYCKQHVLARKFCVDAFIPSHGVVVQFDGDYWHGHPVKFPKPDRRQARRMSLDKSQDAYLAKCGFHVIRFWETDLLKHPDTVTAELRLFLIRCEQTQFALA